MKTIERLKQFIDYKHLSFTSFDKVIEAGNGYIGKQYRTLGSIGSDVVEKIVCAFPELNVTWLMTGEGEMIKTANNYAATPHVNTHAGDTEVVYIAESPTAKKGVTTKKAIKVDPATDPPKLILTPQYITVDNNGEENILHVSIKAAAGYVQGHNDPEYLERLPSFSLPGLKGKTFRSFEVEGDSMEPTLKDKQMVIGEWVEGLDYIREDRVHVLVLKTGKPIIKRLLNRISTRKVIIAKSDATNNRDLYRNQEIDPEDILEVWYARFHGGFDFQAPTDMWKRVNNHEADITILENKLQLLLDAVKSAGIITE